MTDAGYSLENARAFRWPSITGAVAGDRKRYLDNYLLGRAILDAGCGGGAYAEYVASRGLDVTGLDRYADFLKLARRRGQRVRYVQGDILSLPFRSKTFDSSYCFDVLEHVDDSAAIKELARVTKDRLILAVPREDDTDLIDAGLTFYHYRDSTHRRYYREESLRELVSSVPHRHVVVIPEAFVPFEDMFRGLMVCSRRSGAPDARIEWLNGEGWPRSDSLKALVRRAMYPVLARLMAKAIVFRGIPMGLAAIVDLV